MSLFDAYLAQIMNKHIVILCTSKSTLYNAILHGKSCFGIPNKTSISTRFGSYATLASFTDFEASEGEEEDCCGSSSCIIQDKDLLRRSQIRNSPTGLHVLDLIDRGSLEANHALYNNLLRKCTHFGKVKEGRVVHSHIEYSQFKDNLYS